MGALRIQMTLDENVVFTTYNVPLIGVGVGPNAKVAFTTFRKPRMAALCHQLTLYDQVFSKTFRKPGMAAFCHQLTLHDKVSFTTFRKRTTAALCLQINP